MSFYKYSSSVTFLKLFFLIFIFTNLLLFFYIYEREKQPECLRQGTCRINTKPRTLPREKWGQTVYFNILLSHFTRVNDEWRLLHTDRSKSYVPADEFNCTSLKHVEKVNFVAAGYTKATYKVKIHNTILSLKTVNVDGRDITSCLLEEDRNLYDCFLLAASKLLKEITILKSISHENIVKILGYCVPADPDVTNPHHTVAIFEEYGEPVNVIRLLQLSWEDRLRISLGLSRLLKHLSSFEETIALNDFRRQQFIVINGEPKLIDVDDVGLHEQSCNGTPCCAKQTSKNTTFCTPCVGNLCVGHNEKLNIMRTGRHFIKHILSPGAPAKLNALTTKIINTYELALGDTASIFREMEDLASAFKSGKYRESSHYQYLDGYNIYKHKDVSSAHDYRCWLTISSYGCMTSVLDAEEAAEICFTDSECEAFVLTSDTTWTGRKVALFKNGFDDLLQNNQTTLYVKL